MRDIVLIITAAGLGRRLKEYSLNKYGKYLDKPLVKLKNKSLLEWSIKPFFPLVTSGFLKFSSIYIVIRKDQDEEEFKKEITKIHSKINIVSIDKLSQGPGHTAFEACQKINKFRSIEKSTLIVSDSDHTFRSDALVNFFKDKSNKKFNAFCTLKSVPNPEKWGYVYKNKKEFISGEKDILEQSNNIKSKAEFLIGCYIYNSLVSLKKSINDFEKSIYKEKESHHSLLLSLLSKYEPVNTVSSNWGMGLGTPIQLEEAEKSIMSFEGNREPSSFIFDIDGVIFKHDKGSFSETENFDETPFQIKENIDLINELYKSGSYIVLFSSRPESIYEKTSEDLKNVGLKYHKLILGATSGVRYLVNDIKPSNESINTAEAINTIRNEPIPITDFRKIDFIKDCTKGSGAITTILKNQEDNILTVRKWTNSKNESVTKTLSRQYSYLKLMQKYIKTSVPEILDWQFGSKGISYYDMSYIEGFVLSLKLIKSNPSYLENLSNILCSLYESNPINKEKEDFNVLLNQIINIKLMPTIANSEKILKNRINDKDLISFEFISKLKNGLDKISKKKYLWKSHKASLIHGDLTLENIFLCKESIYLIDPLGSTMDIRGNGSMQQLTTPIFDIGKLFQSIISKYESWAYLDENNIKIYIKNFSLEEEFSNISETIKSNNCLLDFFEQYIDGNIIEDSLFSLAQILIRVTPYRIRTNYYHSALVCLLKAYSIIEYMNKI